MIELKYAFFSNITLLEFKPSHFSFNQRAMYCSGLETYFSLFSVIVLCSLVIQKTIKSEGFKGIYQVRDTRRAVSDSGSLSEKYENR